MDKLKRQKLLKELESVEKQLEDASYKIIDLSNMLIGSGSKSIHDLPHIKCRGNIYLELGKYKEAVNDWTYVIDLEPYIAENYIKRSIAFIATQKYEDAINDYSNAIKIEPNNCSFYYERGKLYLKIGLLDEAIFDFTKAIESNATNMADCLLHRAEAYLRANKLDEALVDYIESIELEPSADAYAGRGKVHQEQNKFASALEDYDTAIKLDPENVAAFFHRAEILTHEFRIMEVIKGYGTENLSHHLDMACVEKIPANLDFYISQRNFYNKSEIVIKIIKDYSKVIEIESDYKSIGLAHARRGAFYLALKDYYNAYYDLDYYVDLLSEHHILEDVIYDHRGIIDESSPDEEMADFSYFAELSDEDGLILTYKQLRDIAFREETRIEERNRVIQDLSHSIKNLISTVIDPLENLKEETVIQPQTIQNAIRGANLIREIVNAINLSYKGSTDDLIYDAKHNDGSDAVSLQSMFTESIKQSASNMFDGKYFNNFMRKYFPEKKQFLSAKEDWANLSQADDITALIPFLETHFFHPDIDISNSDQFIMGNEKGSAVKLLIMIQEIILNAVKYTAFIDRDQRFLKIRFSGNVDLIDIKVENPFDEKVKTKTTGTGHVVISNFARLLGTEPVIHKDNGVYSLQITFQNFWETASK